jgi:hypothetical protein
MTAAPSGLGDHCDPLDESTLVRMVAAIARRHRGGQVALHEVEPIAAALRRGADLLVDQATRAEAHVLADQVKRLPPIGEAPRAGTAGEFFDDCNERLRVRECLENGLPPELGITVVLWRLTRRLRGLRTTQRKGH